jgi:hypothetical protein
VATVSRKWRHAFIAVALLVTSAMAVTSVDYGISQDESTHRVHGQILLDYFRGVSDRALWEPLNADGSFPGTAGGYTDFDDPAWRGLNIYAGTFDLLCEAVYRYVPTGLGSYEVRHLLGGLFGALAIVMTGQLARALNGSWATGTLALLFAALTPRLVGHAMTNPKDAPFEGLYFSPVIGGIQGAWGRFEIDYWSISQRAAVEWLAAHARPEPGRLVRVRAYHGDPTS